MAKKAPARKAACGRAQEGGRPRRAARRPGGQGRPGRRWRSERRSAATRGGRKSASASRKTARKAIRKGKPSEAGEVSYPRRRQPPKSKPKPKAKRQRLGGNGDERTLAQTPETGRSVRGRTNPMKTRRSTGTPAGAGGTRLAPGLDRARRQLREVEESLPGPPSSLDLDQSASAARSGRRELEQARREHTETSPVMTAGDVDADWEDAYAGATKPRAATTPRLIRIGWTTSARRWASSTEDNEELKAADKITERDRHRWELDPASAEDYTDRD